MDVGAGYAMGSCVGGMAKRWRLLWVGTTYARHGNSFIFSFLQQFSISLLELCPLSLCNVPAGVQPLCPQTTSCKYHQSHHNYNTQPYRPEKAYLLHWANARRN